MRPVLGGVEQPASESVVLAPNAPIRQYLNVPLDIPPGGQVPDVANPGQVVSYSYTANDASVAVAEYLGGNVENFVKQMNGKARELGMNNSCFKNPNGLPARGQFTTARDILVLACDYLRQFPECLELHSQQYFTYRDITQRNRNSLLRRYPNADGLKTGWVVQAGYHIVATAKRGKTRLIAVVMGAKTPAIRTRETERLLDEGFMMVGRDLRQG